MSLSWSVFGFLGLLKTIDNKKKHNYDFWMYVVQLKRMEGGLEDSKNKFDGIAKIVEPGTWLATSETKGSPLQHFNTVCNP